MSSYNLDKAFGRVGEYGRVQWLLTFVTSIARNGGCYMYYTFAYLVLEQEYLCIKSDTGKFDAAASVSGDSLYQQCTREEICAMRE